MAKSTNRTTAKRPGVYEVDDEVVVTAGRLAGQEGIVDEIDESDPELPYRVRFDADGDPVVWFASTAIKHAQAVAR